LNVQETPNLAPPVTDMRQEVLFRIQGFNAGQPVRTGWRWRKKI